jgi:ribosomal protein L29
MKIRDITEKTTPELEQLATDQRTKLGELHVNMRTKKVENIKEIAATKRTIARALTVLRLRELTELEKDNG